MTVDIDSPIHETYGLHKWGAASFVTETFERVRHAGAVGPFVLHTDSGFSLWCRGRRLPSGRGLVLDHAQDEPGDLQGIAAIDESMWTAIPYFLDGADVADTVYRLVGVGACRCRPGGRQPSARSW